MLELKVKTLQIEFYDDPAWESEEALLVRPGVLGSGNFWPCHLITFAKECKKLLSTRRGRTASAEGHWIPENSGLLAADQLVIALPVTEDDEFTSDRAVIDDARFDMHFANQFKYQFPASNRWWTLSLHMADGSTMTAHTKQEHCDYLNHDYFERLGVDRAAIVFDKVHSRT